MFLETFLLVVYFSYTVLFNRKKQRNQKILVKHGIENLFLLFYVIAREYISTHDTLTRKHLKHVIKWEREHARHVSI